MAALVNHLAKYVDEGGIDDFMARTDGSVTFLAHASLVEAIMKMSGMSGIFLKVHKDEKEHCEMELMWLGEQYNFEEALALSKDDAVMGMAEKGSNGLIALRFKDTEAAAKFAHKHNIEVENLARWKITGVPMASGTHGLVDLLRGQQWIVKDVVYMDNRQAVFHSENKGSMIPMYYENQGQPMQIHIKAMNARAKELMKEDAIEKRAKPKAAPKRNAQFAFLSRVMPSFPLEVEEEEAKTPTQVPPKRQADGHTGETPPQNRARNGEPASLRAASAAMRE